MIRFLLRGSLVALVVLLGFAWHGAHNGDDALAAALREARAELTRLERDDARANTEIARATGEARRASAALSAKLRSGISRSDVRQRAETAKDNLKELIFQHEDRKARLAAQRAEVARLEAQAKGGKP